MVTAMVPQLIVREQAKKDMKSETLKHRHIETAWGNFGFLLPGNRVYLAGIIPPSEDDIIRGVTHAQFGGKRCAEADIWLESTVRNSHMSPRIRYTYLSNGHSHHTLSLFSYSGTDMSSLRKAVEEDGLEVAIGSLSVIRPAYRIAGRNWRIRKDRLVRSPLDDEVKIKYYCYSRGMLEAGIQRPVEVFPEYKDLPGIPVPELGWQFLDEQRYNSELVRLRQRGCTVSVQQKPPVIRFLIKKPEWNGGLVNISTRYDFPRSNPVIKVIPPGSTVITASKQWQKHKTFHDIVSRLEEEGFFHETVPERGRP